MKKHIRNTKHWMVLAVSLPIAFLWIPNAKAQSLKLITDSVSPSLTYWNTKLYSIEESLYTFQDGNSEKVILDQFYPKFQKLIELPISISFAQSFTVKDNTSFILMGNQYGDSVKPRIMATNLSSKVTLFDTTLDLPGLFTIFAPGNVVVSKNNTRLIAGAAKFDKYTAGVLSTFEYKDSTVVFTSFPSILCEYALIVSESDSETVFLVRNANLCCTLVKLKGSQIVWSQFLDWKFSELRDVYELEGKTLLVGRNRSRRFVSLSFTEDGTIAWSWDPTQTKLSQYGFDYVGDVKLFSDGKLWLSGVNIGGYMRFCAVSIAGELLFDRTFENVYLSNGAPAIAERGDGGIFALGTRSVDQVGVVNTFSLIARNPLAPTLLQAEALIETPGTVNLSWKTPAKNGGSAIISYTVSYREKGSSSWNTKTTDSCGLIVSSLNPVPYEFMVTAVNTVGIGEQSDIVTATPAKDPVGLLEIATKTVFSLYPNPVNHAEMITIPENTSFITIYNLFGKVIGTGFGPSIQSPAETGIYFMETELGYTRLLVK